MTDTACRSVRVRLLYSLEIEFGQGGRGCHAVTVVVTVGHAGFGFCAVTVTLALTAGIVFLSYFGRRAVFKPASGPVDRVQGPPVIVFNPPSILFKQTG